MTHIINNLAEPLVSGHRYYGNVVAYNKAGLVAQSSSDGVIFDDVPPKAGIVFDGDGKT